MAFVLYKMILKSNQKILTLNSAFSWHVLAFCFVGVCFPNWAVLNFQLWREKQRQKLFLSYWKKCFKGKGYSIHFITYLWAEVVGFVEFYSKLQVICDTLRDKALIHPHSLRKHWANIEASFFLFFFLSRNSATVIACSCIKRNL